MGCLLDPWSTWEGALSGTGDCFESDAFVGLLPLAFLVMVLFSPCVQVPLSTTTVRCFADAWVGHIVCIVGGGEEGAEEARTVLLKKYVSPAEWRMIRYESGYS